MRITILILIFQSLLLISCKNQEVRNEVNVEYSEFRIDSTLTKLVDKQVSNLFDRTEFAVALTSNDSIFYYGSRNNNGE